MLYDGKVEFMIEYSGKETVYIKSLVSENIKRHDQATS